MGKKLIQEKRSKRQSKRVIKLAKKKNGADSRFRKEMNASGQIEEVFRDSNGKPYREIERLSGVTTGRGIRIGTGYQATIPKLLTKAQQKNKKCDKKYPHLALQVWKPIPNALNSQIDQVIEVGKIYEIEIDQALGVFYFYRYNFAATIAELKKLRSIRNMPWLQKEEQIFVDCLEEWKDDLQEIQKILSYKTMASIVQLFFQNYYHPTFSMLTDD